MTDAAKNLPQTLTLDHVSAATRLLEKRRQMFEVQEALDAQKEEYARREEAFRRREEGLRKKDLELQEQLIKFNRFLTENENKRQRAQKRAEAERKAYAQHNQELQRAAKRLDELQSEFKVLRVKLDKSRRYERYLQMVQEPVREDYQDISDLVARHSTLQRSFDELQGQQVEFEAQSDAMRRQLSEYIKTRNNEILSSTNRMNRLKKQLEQLHLRNKTLHTAVDAAVNKQSEKTLELGQTLMAVDNLLRRCTSKARGPKHTGTDALKTFNSLGDLTSAENQERVLARTRQNLQRIRDHINDYAAICKQWNHERGAKRQGDAADREGESSRSASGTGPASGAGAGAGSAATPKSELHA